MSAPRLLPIPFALLLCAFPLVASSQTFEFNRSVIGLRVSGQDTAAGVQTSTGLVDFGRVVANTTEKRQVALTNRGTAAIRLTAVPSVRGNAAFGASDTSCGSSLAPGDSCITEVSFAPTGEGAFTGALRFSTSIAGAPADVSLTGEAFAPVIEPKATFQGANQAMDFGTIELSTAAPSRQWSFINSGPVAISLQLTGLPACITL
ncbi:choice-of-anchor D domain-containing protein, partial [Nostoc sp. CHAB 5834]|nr:choice-of-anchor D domain-containing protein [Nostoc sp. CHAB 5834]